MRKILGLTVAALLVMGLVGGGTWAFFSDTETASANVFTAGTLDLQTNEADGVSGYFSASAIMPDDATIGDDISANATEGKATLKISNVGTITGYVDISTGVVVNDENAAVVSEAETDTAGDGDLGGLLDIWMFFDVDGDGSYDGGDGDTDIIGNNNTHSAFETGVTTAKLDTLDGSSYDTDFEMAADSDAYITLYWRWADNGSSDNDAQGDTATFSFVVELDQTAD